MPGGGRAEGQSTLLHEDEVEAAPEGGAVNSMQREEIVGDEENQQKIDHRYRRAELRPGRRHQRAQAIGRDRKQQKDKRSYDLIRRQDTDSPAVQPNCFGPVLVREPVAKPRSKYGQGENRATVVGDCLIRNSMRNASKITRITGTALRLAGTDFLRSAQAMPIAN